MAKFHLRDLSYIRIYYKRKERDRQLTHKTWVNLKNTWSGRRYILQYSTYMNSKKDTSNQQQQKPDLWLPRETGKRGI